MEEAYGKVVQYLYIFPTFKGTEAQYSDSAVFVIFWPFLFGISLGEKTVKWVPSCCQCCGSLSGSGFNGVPGSVFGSGFAIGYGSRRAKMTRKHRNKLINFIFLSAGYSLLRAEGFSCSLDIKKLAIFYQNNFIKTMDPDWIRICIRIHVKCSVCCIYLCPLNKRNSPRKRI